MKKVVAITIATFISTAAIFSSGVENKTNMNSGYLRNPSRNTESSRPEAAFYNIAGTAFLDEGLWIGGGNQFVFKEYANELDTNNSYAGFGVKDYYSNDETTVWLYPDLNAVYKKGKWSIFSNFGVYAGGGKLDFEEGTSATTLMFLQGANKYKQTAVESGLKYTSAATLVEGWKSVKQGLADAMPGGDVSKISDEVAAAWASTQADGSSAKTVYEKYYNSENKANIDAVYAKGDESTKYGSVAKASLAMAQNHSLDVTSITYGIQLGASYQVFDWLSLAAAYRYTIGTQDMTLKCDDATFKLINGGNKISYDAVGYGQSCVFGIHAKVPQVEGLNVALQYQTLSRIDYDVDNVKGNVAQYYDITDSKKFRTDLPAVLNFGIGYSIIDDLYVSTSFNYYFNDFAQQNSILSETDYDNSWEVAFGVDYKFCKYVGASAGISYGKQGITDTSNSTFNPVLNNFVVGGGFEIYPVENLTITLSCLYANYFDADYYLGGSKNDSTKTVLSKDVTNCGIGVTYHFPVK